MAKTLKLTFDGTTYELEYTKASVKQMESRGFSISELATKPMNLLPMLFAGAFIAHHPNMRMTEIDKIFEKVTNKEDCLEKLLEMYNEPIDALLDEPDEKDPGKAVWEANW